METTTYRRRVSGRGSRMAGRRRSAGLSTRERRRLLQLGASMLLFFMVFLGRGALPGGAEAWGKALNADMDLDRALSAFRQQVSQEGSVLTALRQGFSVLSGGEEALEEVPTSESTAAPIPEVSPFFLRTEYPGFAAGYPLTPTEAAKEEAEPPAEEELSGEEPVVTAVAQLYDETGVSLPERVSFEYYNLGLEETAVPVSGSVTSGFGFRDHPVSGDYTFHTAIDVGVDNGTEILAFADGTVRYIGENGVFGLYVKLDHDNGVSTFYAHCEELLVSKGERVVCGQVIALSGESGNATGPHLHFSLEKDGIRLDPEYYLDL